MIVGGETDAPGGTLQASGAVNPLEQEKLAVEREKLALEQSKFAAEEAKRSKEIEKLDEEIRELRRPFWKKASSVPALATISLAIIAGTLTFGTNLFKSNILALIAERTHLKKTVAQLSAQEQTLTRARDSLEKERDALVAERRALSENQVHLVAQRDALKQSARMLQQQKVKLQQDVLLAPIQTRIALLSPESPFGLLQYGGPSDESLKTLTDFAVAHKADARIIQFFEDSFRHAEVETTKGSLAFILFEATGQPQWKDTIRQLARPTIATLGWSNLTFFLHLMNSPGLFSKDEKVTILKEFYTDLAGHASPERQEGTTSSDSVKLCAIAKWNKDATTAFREPWLKCRLALIEEYQTNPEARNSLYYFSPQIYGILVLSEAVTPMGLF